MLQLVTLLQFLLLCTFLVAAVADETLLILIFHAFLRRQNLVDSVIKLQGLLYYKNSSAGFQGWSSWKLSPLRQNGKSKFGLHLLALHSGSEPLRECVKNSNLWLVSEYIRIHPAKKIWINFTSSIEYAATKVRLLAAKMTDYKPIKDVHLTDFDTITSGIDAKVYHPVTTSQTMEIVNMKGVYFAIEIVSQPDFFCFTLETFSVSYLQCPGIWKNFAYFPRTAAAGSDQKYEIMEGTCAANTEPLPGSVGPIARCDVKGEMTVIGSCQCKKGFELNSGRCQLCYPNFFKPTGGNRVCQKCGTNSESSSSRTSCPCKIGTYRSMEDNRDSSKDCTDTPPFTTWMTFYITVGLGGLFLLTTFVSIIVIVVQTKRLNRLQMGDRNYQNIENGNNEGDEGDHDHQVLEGEDPNRNNMHENNDRPIPRPRPVQYQNQHEDEANEDEDDDYEPLH